MQIEQNKRIVKVIQTTKGQIRSFWSTQQQATVPFILFNQQFTRQISKSPSLYPVTIQSLSYHISNPYTLQNTSLSWASIQHEYRDVMARNNIKEEDMLIFQSSNYNEKIPEIFKRFRTVKGYNYRIKLDSTQNLSQQKLTLMQEAHVLKQVEMEFALGNGQFRPGFIGEVRFQELEQAVYEGIIMAYINYSAKTGCPVVVDFAGQGEQSCRLLFEGQAKDAVQRVQQKLRVLQGLLNKFKEKNCAQNVILYNLPIVLLYRKENFSTMNYFEARIKALAQTFGVTLGFNLLRYSPRFTKPAIDQIIKLCQSHTSNVIISSAVQYKTDLHSLSGEGLSLYFPYSQNGPKDICYLSSAQYIRHFLNSEQLQQVLKRNILRIFDWKQKKQEIKIEIFWKCEHCKGDFPQTLQAFGKFGKQFCSIKCLKAYKF